MIYNVYVPPLSKIMKLIKFKKKYVLSDTDLYLIEQCYEDVMAALNESGELNYVNIITTGGILECSLQEKYNTPTGKLKAKFPLTTKISYRRKSGNLEVIRYGFHCLYIENYDEYKEIIINQFLFFTVELLRHYCGNIPLKKLQKKEKWTFYSNPEEYPKFRKLMMKVINNGVNDNKYVKNGHSLSPEELEERKNQKEFKLDISDITTVRKKSHDIQNKLIIEDTEIRLKINNVSTNISDKILRNTVSPTNEFELFVLELSSFECDILSALINGNVKAASKIADDNDFMLSIAVDNINLLSKNLIEDVVIIDDAVLDYGKELKKALKILNKNNC